MRGESQDNESGQAGQATVVIEEPASGAAVNAGEEGAATGTGGEDGREAPDETLGGSDPSLEDRGGSSSGVDSVSVGLPEVESGSSSGVDSVSVGLPQVEGGSSSGAGSVSVELPQVEGGPPSGAESVSVEGPQGNAESSSADETGSREYAWIHDPEFFRREARELADRQPERAALMYVEAAAAAERAGGSSKETLGDAEEAIKLRPSSAWLLPLARRVLLRQKRYDRALEICRKEVELGGENATRSAVLLEAHAISRYHRNARKKALEYLEKALASQPGDIISLCGAVALRNELALHAPAAQAMEQIASLLTVPEERALYLYAAGTIREMRLDQLDAAETDYRRAVEQDRQCLPVVLALKNLHERRSLWAPLCTSLEHLAQLAPNAAVEARLLYQAGSLHLDRTGDLEAASRDLEGATRAAPEDPHYLQRLACVYEAKGHYRDLVGTLRRLLHLTLDAQGRAAILAQIGWLLQVRLGEVEEAIEAYREALAVAPGYLPALQALGTLYRTQGDYESLLAIYTPEVESTLPANVRAIRCVEMAEILSSRLDRPQQAVHYFRRALDLDPGCYLAFWGLRRLLKELHWHQELADLLASQAGRSRDDKTRHHLLLELAVLRAGPLEEVDQAIEVLEGIGTQDRTRSVALSLVELYEQSGRSAEMVGLLLDMANDTTDPSEAQGLRLQAASELEFSLEEYDRALEIYRQVLDGDAQCVAAIRGAGRIYHRLNRWLDLVDLHFHELNRLVPESGSLDFSRPDAPALLCRIGRILEENLGQVPQAIDAYSSALEQDPSCIPALSALERLVRAQRQWKDLVNVLIKYAAARRDHVASADALCRAAEVADFQLDNLELSARLYLEARELNPLSSTAPHGLVRVCRRMQSWDKVAELLQELIASCDCEEERGQYQLELARVKEYRLGEMPDLELLQAAARTSSLGHRLRLELTRILRRSLDGTLADWLQALGQRTSDPALAVAYFIESVHLREFSRDVAERGRLESARQAHQRKPDALPVIWGLERALWSHQCWSDLGVLREMEAQMEADLTVRVVKLSGASVAYLQAGECDSAAQVARKALNFDAHCLTALHVLAYLAKVRNDWTELASIYDRLAEACQDPQNRLVSCIRAADLWFEQLGDSTRALASLSVALTAQPGEPRSFARAERLMRLRQEYNGLSSLYKWRINSCQDPREKVELLRRHAVLLRDDLSDPNRAIAEFSALLDLAPGDIPALSSLCRLLVAQEHWSDAAVKLATLVTITPDDLERSRSRLDLAALLLRHLNEPREARKVLMDELAVNAEDLTANRLMVELCVTEGNWSQARGILEEMTRHDDLDVRLWALTELTEVARLGLRDEGLRRKYETEALVLVTREPALLPALMSQYWNRRDPSSLVDRVEEVLKTRGDSPGAVPLRTLAACQLLDKLNQPSRALTHLKECRALDPSNEDVHLLMCRALEHLDDGGLAGREYRSLLQEHVGNVEAYRGLSRVMSQIGQHETAAAATALIDLLGTLEPKEITLLRGLEGVMMPPGRIDPASMPLPESVRPLQTLFDLVMPHLGLMYPTAQPEILAHDHPISAACRRLAGALGLGDLTVSLGGIAGARAGLGDPIPLVLAPELRDSAGSAAFRFWVGRALATAVSRSQLLDRLNDERLVDLIEALCDPRPQSNTSQQIKKQLSRVLPRKVKKDLELMDTSGFVRQLPVYRAAEQRRADQVALLMCRNPREGIIGMARALKVPEEEIIRSARLVELMQYAISDDYARRSRALWH